MLTTIETANWLNAYNRYLIITHRRPDGDTVGCASALAQGLRERGKVAYVLYNPEITPRYQPFLDDYWAPEDFSPDKTITVDTASKDMFPINGAEYLDAVSLCIDHHASNTNFAEYACVDEARAACGELVYDILLSLGGKISEKTAERLYTAISTDTGCFAYANTSSDTLRIASELIKVGAPHTELNKMLFRTKTKSRMKIEGMILSGLGFYFDGAVSISTITRKMLDETSAVEDDIDDIASIPGSIEGVLVGITIREMTSENDCKVSVRSSPMVSAADICARFGGGGHAMAAGFNLKNSVAEIQGLLLDALPDFLPKL